MLIAVENFILSAPASSLHDAAVQLMVAYSRLDDTPPDRLEHMRSKLSTAILSSFEVVAAAAQLDMLTVAAQHYVPPFALGRLGRGAVS